MSSRITVQIPVRPWFKDHNFNGKVIFPAVETMLLLADIAKTVASEIYPQNMLQARFLKFLEIPEGVKVLSAFVEYEKKGDKLALRLLSKIHLRKMSRIQAHAELHFSTKPLEIHPVKPADKEETGVRIDATRIYRELVPFGPTYHSIKGKVQFSQLGAFATLQAPHVVSKQRMEDIVGSPFPLDGAMHTACVLGQCIADFVPFPVGFDVRSIHQPTRAGEKYSTTVLPVTQTQNELVFDLSIFSELGEACETIKGLRMRDVSGGSIKPAADLPKVTFFP